MERLSPMDAALLDKEERGRPLHVTTILVCDPPARGDFFEAFTTHLEARLALVPKYRCKVVGVPGGLASPVWAEDEHFDISYHVRASALPKPGDETVLNELISRIAPRRLDRSHPLWEVYVVEGLSAGRVAVVAKTHPALVGAAGTLDVAQVALDAQASDAQPPVNPWVPRAQPTGAQLVSAAVTDALRSPVRTTKAASAAVKRSVARMSGTRMLQGAARVAHLAQGFSRRSSSPLIVGHPSTHRRFTSLSLPVDGLRAVRDHYSPRTDEPSESKARITVNDVVLALLTGGLRSWLMGRGWHVEARGSVRALLPVSVDGPAVDPALSTNVEARFVDLPIGEPHPGIRLRRIAFQTAQPFTSGRAVSAKDLMGLQGFAPPTLHAAGLRVASDLAERGYELMMTNVPGPADERYIAGAKLVHAIPVMPIVGGQSLAVGVTSYRGTLHFGLTADRDAVPDIADLRAGLQESYDQLRDMTTAPDADQVPLGEDSP